MFSITYLITVYVLVVDVITPSSWREGQKLISKELGPGRPSKTSSNVQDQIARDTENTNVIDG